MINFLVFACILSVNCGGSFYQRTDVKYFIKGTLFTLLPLEDPPNYHDIFQKFKKSYKQTNNELKIWRDLNDYIITEKLEYLSPNSIRGFNNTNIKCRVRALSSFQKMRVRVLCTGEEESYLETNFKCVAAEMLFDDKNEDLIVTDREFKQDLRCPLRDELYSLLNEFGLKFGCLKLIDKNSERIYL